MTNRIHSNRQKIYRQLLKDFRVAAELNQVEIAKRLKKPQSYISKVESGERKLDIIELVDYCSALGISIVKFAQALQAAVQAEKE